MQHSEFDEHKKNRAIIAVVLLAGMTVLCTLLLAFRTTHHTAGSAADMYSDVVPKTSVKKALVTTSHMATLNSMLEDRKRALEEQNSAPPAKDRAQWMEQRATYTNQLRRVLSHYIIAEALKEPKTYADYRSRPNIVPRAVLLDAFFQLVVAFDQLAHACNATEYWIDYGTLVGCHRNGFLLPWDKDSDVSITEATQARLRQCVTPVAEGGDGVSLRYPFVLSGRFDRDPIIPGRIFHHPTGAYLDVFVWYEYPRNRSASSTETPTDTDRQFLWHQWSVPRHKELLFPLSTIECRNIAAGAVERWYSTAGLGVTVTDDSSIDDIPQLPQDLSTLPGYVFKMPRSPTEVLRLTYKQLKPYGSHVKRFGKGIYGNMDDFDELHCEQLPCHPTDILSCRNGFDCCCPKKQ